PAKIDPAARVEAFEPGPDTAKRVESIEKTRADRVQNSRAALAGLIEEPTARVAGRRAPIEIAETRAKTIVERKDAAISTADLLPHQDSALAGRSARDLLQPKTSVFAGSGRVVERYQQSISAASGVALPHQTDLGRQTTFDRFNRFVPKRNGPGSEGGSALVTAAGGGAASVLPTAADRPEPESQPDFIGGGSSGIELWGVMSAPGKPPPAERVVQMPGSGPVPASGAPV